MTHKRIEVEGAFQGTVLCGQPEHLAEPSRHGEWRTHAQIPSDIGIWHAHVTQNWNCVGRRIVTETARSATELKCEVDRTTHEEEIKTMMK